MATEAPEVGDKSFLSSLGSHLPIRPTRPLVLSCLVLLSRFGQKMHWLAALTLLIGNAH